MDLLTELLMGLAFFFAEIGEWVAQACLAVWQAMVEVIRYRQLEREEKSGDQRK